MTAKQLIDGQWLVFSLDDKTGLTKAMQLHNTIWPSLTNKLADWLKLPDLPLQIATTETVVTDIKVHPFNGITHLTHGNGISDDYGFDLAGRLITVSHDKANTANSGQATINSPQTSPFIQTNYTYDTGRRLLSEKIDNANPISEVKQGQIKHYRYHYNVWGKLASVENKSNNTTIATYQSNAFGERVMASYAASTSHQHQNTSQTHYYLYDHQQRIAELD